MPRKYHIDTEAAPPRFTPVGKFGIVDFNEDCAGACHHCVKKECIYEIYKKEGIFTREMAGPVHYLYSCMNCLRCVQGCTRAVLTRIINPEFRWLGDDYWRPEIILNLWYQSETGKIPVSGAGYRGKFSGPGFDSMWTDMSEIVRPTRDGIHGREYINTSVDVGRILGHLEFDSKGKPLADRQNFFELPVPFILEKPFFGDYSPNMFEAYARAAKTMGTLFLLDAADYSKKLKSYKQVIAPRIKGRDIRKYRNLIKGAKLVELVYDSRISANISEIKRIKPETQVSVEIPLSSDSHLVAEKLVEKDVEVIHFTADFHGNVRGSGKDPKGNGDKPEFIKDVFRRIHTHLVDKGLRDYVTLVAGGGIAMAEHMAKIIICGADLVSLGIPFLIALECRMCMNCTRGRECPVDIASVPPDYGEQRILNLSAAWRNQLLEVLGAMGLREVRRLRGEFGRAMFMEDLERDTFQRIFSGGKGKKKKANQK